MVNENISFMYASVEKPLVEYMQDKFFEGNTNLENYDVQTKEIKEINNRYVLRIFMTPKQKEFEFEGAAVS